LSFDEHSADYSQKVERALAVVGLEHDFFFEAKVRQILEARRRSLQHPLPLHSLLPLARSGLAVVRSAPRLASLGGQYVIDAVRT
jgi:hypothetical protein